MLEKSALICYCFFMKKIFITGGLGYIGSKLAREALDKGFSVTIYDSILYKQDYKKILSEIEKKKRKGAICRLVIGDTRNLDLLKNSLTDAKPDYLFHFAELVGIHICNDNPSYTKDVNFEASKSIIDLAEELKIPTIYNSTSSLYGNQKDKKVLNENALLPKPTDNYCKYKLETENYIKQRIKKNPRFRIIMLRLATVSGLSPRMRLELLPNHFTYCAVSKGLIKISESESFRAQIDIDDLLDSYFTIMEKDHWPKAIYNLGHHNLQKIQIAKIIQSVVDCKIERVGNLGDPRNLQINSSAFYKDFDFKPKYDFKDTIKTLARWIRKNQKIIEKSNFLGTINSPFSEWLKII